MDELTTTEAAVLKGVSRQAVYQAILHGRLPARMRRRANGIRTSYYVERAVLDAWVPAVTPAERGKIGGRGRTLDRNRVRAVLAEELRGSMPNGRLSLDDFLAAKHADMDAE